MTRRLLTALLALSLGVPPFSKAAPSGVVAEGSTSGSTAALGATSLGGGQSLSLESASIDLSLAPTGVSLTDAVLSRDSASGLSAQSRQAQESARQMPETERDAPVSAPILAPTWFQGGAGRPSDTWASGRGADQAVSFEGGGRYLPPPARERLNLVGRMSQDAAAGARGSASMGDSYRRAGRVFGAAWRSGGDPDREPPSTLPFAGVFGSRGGAGLGRRTSPARSERTGTDLPDVLSSLPKEWVEPSVVAEEIRAEMARNGVAKAPEIKLLPAGSSRKYAYDFEANVIYLTLNENGKVELVAAWEEAWHAVEFLTGVWSKEEFLFAAKAGGDVGAANDRLKNAKTLGERADALHDQNEAWTRYQLNRPESSAKRKALERAHVAALARLREVEDRLALRHPHARLEHEPWLQAQRNLVLSYQAAIGWFTNSFRVAHQAFENGLHQFSAPEYALAASADLSPAAYAYLTVGEPAAAGSLRSGDLVWVTPAAGGQPRLGVVNRMDPLTEIWFLDAHGAFESGEQAAWNDIAPRLRHAVRHEPADVEQRLAYLEGVAQRRQSRLDEGVRRVLGELVRELAPADWRTLRPDQVSPQLARLFQAVLSLELDTPPDQGAYRSPVRVPDFSPVGELFRAGIGMAPPAEGAKVAAFEDRELEVRPAFGAILEAQLRARKASVDDRFSAEAFANRLRAGLAVVIAPFDNAADAETVLRKFADVEVELSSFRGGGEPIMILSLGWGRGAVPRLREFSFANAHSNYPDDGSGAQSGADQIVAAAAFANHLARYEVVFAGFGGEPGLGVVAWAGHHQPRSWHVSAHPHLEAALRAAGFIR